MHAWYLVHFDLTLWLYYQHTVRAPWSYTFSSLWTQIVFHITSILGAHGEITVRSNCWLGYMDKCKSRVCSSCRHGNWQTAHRVKIMKLLVFFLSFVSISRRKILTSPEPSGVSLKSNKSIIQPPEFCDGRLTSGPPLV